LLSHVFIGINDFDRAFGFYSKLMTDLGLVLKFSEPEKPWAGWMQNDAPRPLLIIGRPYDRGVASPGNGQMVALLAKDRATVDRCFATAIANGSRSEGLPGIRPEYHPNYYGAYFRDPDGNKLCVCCHEPA
jgi:catechol 2,3-dioxygenase-like lactoylglutathione lyase family enzyme